MIPDSILSRITQMGDAANYFWIESWYNPTRRHSGLGYLSPNNFEKKLKEKNQITIDYNSNKQVETFSIW
jgi:putative transposase